MDSDRSPEKLEALTDEVRRLEREVQNLNSQLVLAQAGNEELVEQVAEMETAHADMIALFVASTRLHASFDYVSVIHTVGEIITNLVGATAFGIYLVDTASDGISLIKSYGCDEVGIAMGMAMAARAIDSGETQTAGRPAADGSPLAAVPLLVGHQPMGAIVLNRLVEHKCGLEPRDFDLFDLLAKNASTALYGAKLHHLARVEERHGEQHPVVDLMPPPVFSPRRSVAPRSRK